MSLPIARRRGREVLCQSRSPDCNPCTPGRLPVAVCPGRRAPNAGHFDFVYDLGVVPLNPWFERIDVVRSTAA